MREKEAPGKPAPTSRVNSEHLLKRRRIARRIAEKVAAVPGVTSVAIIGSVATGEAREDSDIDLAVTYRDRFDRRSFEAACDRLGRDPHGIAASSDPLVFIAALLVEGVRIGLVLGPESYLFGLARAAEAESLERYRLCLRSYAAAVVLYDPHALWPAVIRAVRDAGRRLGEYPDVE